MSDSAYSFGAYKRLSDLEAKVSSFAGGGGSGHNDGMENRLITLEQFADDAKQRLARVETKLDHIDKEVSNFKWWVLAQIVAALLTVIGTGIAIQQMTVSTFQAAGAQAQPTQQQPIIINVPQAATAPAPTN